MRLSGVLSTSGLAVVIAATCLLGFVQPSSAQQPTDPTLEESATVEASSEPSHTAPSTQTPTSTPTATVTDTATITETPIPGETISPTPTETTTPTDTPTPTPVPPVIISGRAVYQNRQGGSDGIHVAALDETQQIVLNRSITGERGRYQIEVPAGLAIWLWLDAPLHQPSALLIAPGEAPPDIELRGGDLDDSGCINALDLALLTASFMRGDSPETDINGDGATNASDLAILSGNYDASCEPQLTNPFASPTPSGEASPTPDSSASLPPTDTDPTSTSSSPTPTLTPTPTDSANDSTGG